METAKSPFGGIPLVGIIQCAAIFLVLVSGCAGLQVLSSTGVGLEELEAEALTTGNWSKVESREARKRQEQEHAARVQYCADSGKTLVCEGISRRYLDCYCAG